MEKASSDYKYLYIDNTWVISYNQLCEILLACSDASSTLAKEFIEASVNGVLSEWLRQSGRSDEAEALEQLMNNDDDKEYIDAMKKIILGNTPDIPVSRRPALKEYAELVEVFYRLDHGQWNTLRDKIVVAPEDSSKCDLKFVFRSQKAIKLVYPLSLSVGLKDPMDVEKVASMLEKDPLNRRKKDEEIMALAKSQTMYTIDFCRLKLAGKTSNEPIEIVIEDVLPAEHLRTEYDYKLAIRVDPDGEIWECAFIHSDFLPFEVGGVRFYMKRVKGGRFQMGASPDDNNSPNDEKPQHWVELKDYFIGETAVTQELWKAVGCAAPTKNNGWSEKGEGGDYPAYNVTWEQCRNGFVSMINKILRDELPEDYVFALPTEAQWEYAARGGRKANPNKSYKYSGSDDINEVAWYSGNSGSTPHPVKPVGSEKKKANELGVYYMSGNVWEWCEDWYDSDYYITSPETDPIGPSSGLNRVLRGGSWSRNAINCRVSNRYFRSPSDCSYCGFRLALVHRSTRTMF